ncbi:MAG: delta-60 repeat domain-containing protein [Dokdonella sp.]|uniref:delta-60 repeat domain-containing protein n=1 Tax=Dokdonella sp. TaxID=2291710 RepID=UPI003F7D55D8
MPAIPTATTTFPRGAIRAIALSAFALLLAASGNAMADDGDPDPTFSGDGKALFPWPTTYSGMDVLQVSTEGVAVLGDGSVVTVGAFDTASVGDDDFDACGVAKFTSSGAVDAAFGLGGWQLVHLEAQPFKDDCIGIVPTPGNGMIVVGATESMTLPYETLGLVKLRADGTLDPTFGNGGKIRITSQPFGANAGMLFHGVVRAPDGKLLAYGYCTNCGRGSFEDFMVVRINANGSVDTGFGNAGWVSFGRTDASDHYLPEVATALAVDTHGRIVVAGHREDYDDQDDRGIPMLVRLLPNGQLDTSFAGTGFLDIDLLGSYAVPAIAIDPYNDGVIVAANINLTSSVTPGTLVFRVRRDGSLDTNFGDSGLVVLQYEDGSNVAALAVRQDRRIVAAGWIDPTGAGTRSFFAARMHSTGVLDATFDGNGVNRYTFSAGTADVQVATTMTLSGERPVIAGLLTPTGPFPDSYTLGVLRLQSDAIFEDGLDP